MGFNSSEVMQRYWLMTGQSPTGPFDLSEVHAQLAAGAITWQTLACPVGGTTWLPLLKMPGVGPSPAVSAPPPLPSTKPVPPEEPLEVLPVPAATVRDVGGAAGTDSPVTNAQLPTMGNLICTYCLAIAPFLWVVQNMSCCLMGPMFRADSPLFGVGLLIEVLESVISLAITAYLFFGGWQLRNLAAGSWEHVRRGLYLSLGYSVLSFLGGVLVLISLVNDPVDHFSESTLASEVIGCGSIVLGLAEFTFVVIAAIWMTRYPMVPAALSQIRPTERPSSASGIQGTSQLPLPAMPSQSPQSAKADSSQSGCLKTLITIGIAAGVLSRTIKRCDGEKPHPSTRQPPAQTAPMKLP